MTRWSIQYDDGGDDDRPTWLKVTKLLVLLLLSVAIVSAVAALVVARMP